MLGKRVMVVGAAPWRERGRSEQEQGEELVKSAVKESRLQRREGGKTRRASLCEVKGSISISKISPRRSAESWFHSQVWENLKWERRLGDEEPAHKMKE